MSNLRLQVMKLIAVALIPAAGILSAQDYPNRPIRIVTGAPGSGSNLVAQVISQGVTAPFGQSVIVDPRGALIAVETVAKAQADGYTLLLYGSTIWIEPLLRSNLNWDTARDFAPVILTSRSPNVIVTHPSLPVNSVRELIAFAKARPGQLNYGSAAASATSHLAAELFNSMAGVNIVGIIYRGNGLALNDLVGGQLQVAFPSASEAMPYVKAGRLRFIAVTSSQPSALAPGVPTAAASGLPGFVSESLLGMLAPTGTPTPIINRLNQEVDRFLRTSGAKERFLQMGLDALGSTPEQFGSTIKSEVVKWGKVIKDVGIRAD